MRHLSESQGSAGAGPNPFLVSAIENKEVLSFIYQGKLRIVEPQTYGVSTAGNHVLRLHQIGGESRSGEQFGKLFEVAKMSRLKKTGAHFEQALPQHNPNDKAMNHGVRYVGASAQIGARKPRTVESAG